MNLDLPHSDIVYLVNIVTLCIVTSCLFALPNRMSVLIANLEPDSSPNPAATTPGLHSSRHPSVAESVPEEILQESRQ